MSWYQERQFWQEETAAHCQENDDDARLGVLEPDFRGKLEQVTKPSMPSDSVLPSSAEVSDFFVRTDQTLHFQRACAPSKTCQIQKSFWIPSNQPLNTCVGGWAYFSLKNMFSWNTLVPIQFCYCLRIRFHLKQVHLPSFDVYLYFRIYRCRTLILFWGLISVIVTL